MIALVDLRTDDTLRIQAKSFRLHTLHSQFARIIESLGVVGHLNVLADLLHPLAYTLLGNVVDTVTHYHAHGPVTGLEQGPEILTGKVRGEGHAACVAKRLTVTRANSRADSYKLGQGLTPLGPCNLQPHTDDTICAQCSGFLLHTCHG